MPRGTNYELMRRAVLADLRRGVRSRNDVCDAHPELLRAARNVGDRAGIECPVCGGPDLYYVSYVYGDGLKHANGRCLSYPGELEKLRDKHDEFDRYVVEVCTDCRWNHLGARELHGRRHAVQGAVTDRVCENCAMADDELVLVRRVYVTPERWDSPEASAREVGDPELWCVSCCSQYPHVALADEEDTTD